MKHWLSCVMLLALAPALASAQDAIAPGELVVEPSTLICAGFQWFGTGDANRNATVDVAYRKAGAEDWKAALPLYRLDNEGEGLPLLAGSVMDLEEDTEYEFSLTLKDPDGIEGSDGPVVKTVKVRTWKTPAVPTEGMTVHHVYPAGYKGEKQEPSHITLQAGLRGGRGSGWQRGEPAGPGTILLLHGGVYQGRPTDYRDINALHFNGSYAMANFSGDDERPLVLKAAGDGEAIIDGADAFILFDCVGAKNIHFEGLTIRNCDIAFQLSDMPHRDPSENISIVNCTIEDVRVVAYGGHPGNRRFYAADNRLTGRQKAIVGSWGDFTSAAAFGVAGRGHVICHNRSRRFFDFWNNWGFTRGGRGGRAGHKDNSAVDVYNNDVQVNGDNAVGMFPGVNLRCLRNFVLNAGDPQMDTRNDCGPIYYIRNVVWNQRADRAFKTDGSIHGLYAFHNTMSLYPTSTSGYARVVARNNLFLGAPEVSRGQVKPAMEVSAGQAFDADYNGYKMEWPDKEGPVWKFEGHEYTDFREFAAAWGQEGHAVDVDFDAFRKAVNPHVLERTEPHSVHLIDEAELDLRLADGSAAVDAGVVISNVNDDFAGTAPDLGAYETGRSVPHYGPRMVPTPAKILREPEGTDAAAVPADPGEPVVRVCVGSGFAYEAPNGARWESDAEYEEGRRFGYVGGTATNRGGDVAGTVLDQVYNRDRWGMDAYRFELPAGDYVGRLHFAEGWHGEPGRRVFDVRANGELVLDDFDIVKEAGGKSRAVHRDVAVKVADKGLTVGFEKVTDNPSINGIEIFRK